MGRRPPGPPALLHRRGRVRDNLHRPPALLQRRAETNRGPALSRAAIRHVDDGNGDDESHPYLRTDASRRGGSRAAIAERASLFAGALDNLRRRAAVRTPIARDPDSAGGYRLG